MKHHILRWILFLIIGVGIGFAINNYLNIEKDLEGVVIPLSPDQQADVSAIIRVPPPDEATKESEDSVAGAEAIGGDFSLVDQNGKEVTQADYADSYKLVFFGFTYCPAVCPTELNKMTKIMEGLPKEITDKIQPIFITVDPERDTPERIKEYLESFSPKMVGLTGTKEQVSDVAKAYRVYTSKIETPGMDGYMINHSAYTYLMNPDDQLLEVYPDKDTADEIIKDLSARSYK